MAGLPGQMELPFEHRDPRGFLRPGYPSRYTAVARYLREHPGEWACIERRPTNHSAVIMARNIRTGRPRVLNGCDAVVRRGFEVWCRWPDDAAP